MGYPEHPETIVLKNKFYPKGLKEIDIWNYYQKVKRPLLEQIRNRDLMFFIMVDVNKPVIRRKVPGGYIRMTPNNYDEVITGRTISIHSAMGRSESFGIIDVDVHPSDGFKWAKRATNDVYEFVMDKMPILKKVTIRYTGKGSFHVVCDFGRRMKVDSLNFLFQKFLKGSELERVYTIGGKRRPGVPNLDLNRNCVRCNYITLHSLSVWGLKSVEVPYQQLFRFDPNQARI